MSNSRRFFNFRSDWYWTKHICDSFGILLSMKCCVFRMCRFGLLKQENLSGSILAHLIYLECILLAHIFGYWSIIFSSVTKLARLLLESVQSPFTQRQADHPSSLSYQERWILLHLKYYGLGFYAQTCAGFFLFPLPPTRIPQQLFLRHPGFCGADITELTFHERR